MRRAAVDVVFDRVSKRYRISTPDRAPGRWMARMLRRRTVEDFWAVRDISFEVGRGETLGIIGHNGAGKSTLLKLLSRITTPTDGEIRVHGRLAALIEVGSGFHPELSGRENIFLSGSVLGMRRREIAGKLDRIIDFSGVSSFIDTPVKWYSSGMYVRLGFAIAAHVDADVLLVDEVLAVGDAEFQAKCLGRIDELRRQGTTMVFISHDLTSVERVCDRALLLQRGRVVTSGVPADVTAEYHRRVAAGVADAPSRERPDRPAAGIELTGIEFGGRGGAVFRTGEPLTTRLRYHALEPLEDLAFEVTYYSPDGQVIVAQCSTAGSGRRVDLPAGAGAIEFEHPTLNLQPGAYYVGATVKKRGLPYNLHWWDGGTMLYVEGSSPQPGLLFMPHRWRLTTEIPLARTGTAGAPRGPKA
jgi:ABC-type polysaccharide/polyol phosphate transport system ATPase subunit